MLREFGNVKANWAESGSELCYSFPISLPAISFRRTLSSSQVTNRMKAILCEKFGSPDDLLLADIPDPVAGPGEVVVNVKAAGLNFFDTLIVAGKYQTKPAFPFSPGGELSGVVESTGPGVTAFRAGDRVMGYSN